MITLEKLCLRKIRAMRNIVITEDEVRCRNCENPDGCENYIPYNSNSQISVRRGIVAYNLEK